MSGTKSKGAGLALTAIQMLAVPVGVLLVMELIVRAAAGTSVISNSADIRTLFRNLISTLAFALALSTNLNCGRMDLSLGAQMYAGVIFGGNLALSMGWGGLGIIVCAIVIGGACGLITGLIFTNLRILPMVLGLGMTLVFECICFAVNNQQGVVLYGKPGVEILSDITLIVVVVLLLVAVSTYLFQFSRYGFRYRAIQGSQKLAADAGINIYSNCVLCYLLAGCLVACAGVFTAAFSGSLTPVLGMTSNASVFKSMFPMILGAWIGSFCNNRQLGVLMGSLSVNIFNIGLSKLGLSISVQNVILYTLFLLFVVFMTNKHKLRYRSDKNRRIALAKKIRAEGSPVAV